MQIRRSRCKSASVYMAIRAGLGTGVDLGAGLGFGEPGAEPGPGKSGGAISGILGASFFAVAPLRAESLSGLLEMAEPFWGFL